MTTDETPQPAKPTTPEYPEQEIKLLREHILNLEERLATLERAQDDVDKDFITAGTTLDKLEARVSDCEARLDGIRPSYKRCKGCKRVLRTASGKGKCPICQTINE